MTTPYPIQGPQQISPSPLEASRVLGRFSVPIAPAQVAAFSDGRVVVVYEGLSSEAVCARIISPDGSLSPEIAVEHGVSAASVAVLPNDDFVVAYRWSFGGRWVAVGTILAQLYNPDGSPNTLFNIAKGSDDWLWTSVWGPCVASMRGDRTFVVLWSRGHLRVFRPSQSRLAYSIIDPVKPQPSVQVVFPQSPISQNWKFNACPQIDWLNGIFFIVSETDDGHIFETVRSYTGSMEWEQRDKRGNHPTGAFLRWHGDTRTVVAFTHPLLLGVKRIDYVVQGAGVLFGTYTGHAGLGSRPALAALAEGRFVIAWEAPNFGGIRARLFNPDGSPETNEFELSAVGAAPSIVATPNGGFYAVWMDYPGPVSPSADPSVHWVIKGQPWGFA